MKNMKEEGNTHPDFDDWVAQSEVKLGKFQTGLSKQKTRRRIP